MSSAYATRRFAALVAALMIPAATAFAMTEAPNSASAPHTEPSIMVFNQKATGNKVKVSYAYLPSNGYVVIYGSDSDGKPVKDALGQTALKAGDHRDIVVELKSTPAKDARLWASLYQDKDGDGKHKAGTDTSLWADSKLPLENEFTIQ